MLKGAQNLAETPKTDSSREPMRDVVWYGAFVHKAILSLIWAHLNPSARMRISRSDVDVWRGLNARLGIQRRRSGPIVRPKSINCVRGKGGFLQGRQKCRSRRRLAQKP